MITPITSARSAEHLREPDRLPRPLDHADDVLKRARRLIDRVGYHDPDAVVRQLSEELGRLVETLEAVG